MTTLVNFTRRCIPTVTPTTLSAVPTKQLTTDTLAQASSDDLCHQMN
jgi:hypothetical protein